MFDFNIAIIASSFAMSMLAAVLGVMQVLNLIHLKFEINVAMPIRFVIGLVAIGPLAYIPGIFIGKMEVISETEGVVAFFATLIVCALLYRKVLSLPNKADTPS